VKLIHPIDRPGVLLGLVGEPAQDIDVADDPQRDAPGVDDRHRPDPAVDDPPGDHAELVVEPGRDHVDRHQRRDRGRRRRRRDAGLAADHRAAQVAVGQHADEPAGVVDDRQVAQTEALHLARRLGGGRGGTNRRGVRGHDVRDSAHTSFYQAHAARGVTGPRSVDTIWCAVRGFVAGRRPLVVIAAIVGAASPAAADPAAEQLFRDGRQLLKDGQRDEACERFQRSQDLEPKVGTLLNLADCREKQGRVATAWDDFLQAKALAVRQKDDRAIEAAKRAAALELRLPYLTVELAEPRRVPGIVVSRNGVAVAPAALNTGVPLDPGSYAVEARAPGYAPWSTRIELAEGARAVVSIPALASDPSAPPDATPIGPVAEVPGAPAAGHMWPPLRRGSLGVALGSNTDGDVVFGVRGSVGGPVGPGALRFLLTGLYTKYGNTPGDPADFTRLYALGGAVDYVLAWRRGLASAFGVGVGVDLVDASYGSAVSAEPSVSPRVSPVIVRLAKPHLELGLHLHFALPQTVLIGVVGVDWYIW